MTYMRDDQSGPPELDAQVAEALGRLERQAGERLGDPEDPLLLAVRRGGRSRGRAICPGA